MDESRGGFYSVAASKSDVDLVADVIEKLQSKFESRIDRLETSIAFLQSTLNSHARAILSEVTKSSCSPITLNGAAGQQPQNPSQTVHFEHIDGLNCQTPHDILPDARDSAYLTKPQYGRIKSSSLRTARSNSNRLVNGEAAQQATTFSSDIVFISSHSPDPRSAPALDPAACAPAPAPTFATSASASASAAAAAAGNSEATGEAKAQAEPAADAAAAEGQEEAAAAVAKPLHRRRTVSSSRDLLHGGEAEEDSSDEEDGEAEGGTVSRRLRHRFRSRLCDWRAVVDFIFGCPQAGGGGDEGGWLGGRAGAQDRGTPPSGGPFSQVVARSMLPCSCEEGGAS
jgi:hypothetical protein